MFDLITKEINNRFNLGDKALPLVQILVGAMTNKETHGLAGFLEQFKSRGLGPLVDSWLHTAAPLSINHAEIEDVLGGKGKVLETIISGLGLDKGSALMGLAYLLPNLVHHLAPGGNIPTTFSPELVDFAKKGLALSSVGSIAASAAASPTVVDETADVPKAVAGVAASVSTTAAGTAQAVKGGLFDSLVEDVRDHFNFGDQALSIVQTVVAAMTNTASGGVTGFISKFKNQGLGDLVDSWLQGVEPLDINHAQIEDVLGEKGGLLETLITKLGLDKGSALLGLGYLLPKLFHKLAPSGNVSSAATSEVSSFAAKGFALLGIGGAAAMSSQSAPVLASTPAPIPAPTPVYKPAPAPAPIPAPAKHVPLAKTVGTSASTAAIPQEEEEEGNIWKSLLWLLPIVLGLWLLKSCGHSTDDATTNTAGSPVPNVADSANVADAVPTTPASEQSAEVESAKMAENTPVPAPAHEAAPLVTIAPAPVYKEPEAAKTSADADMPIPSAKIYFQVGKTALPADTKAKLAPVLKYLKAHKGAKVKLSGFHDPRGNQAVNELLAKNRAKQVHAKLRAAGIADSAIVMDKPQSTTGSGTNDEARRVEVNVNP